MSEKSNTLYQKGGGAIGHHWQEFSTGHSPPFSNDERPLDIALVRPFMPQSRT